MSSGDISLLDVAGSPESNLLVCLNLITEYSSLQQTPVWPILFWNLLGWRQKYNPGPQMANCHSGMEIEVTGDDSAEKIMVTFPSGRGEEIPVWQKRGVFCAEETGIYRLKIGARQYSLAANLCSRSESDLGKKSCLLPDLQLVEGESGKFFAEVRWWFLVPALVLLALHQWLAAGRRKTDVH
jgi:hypothetical protein